ncbi:hypothetical protein MK280_07515 [Myxococcota bacterium]|nr:hypothetical protein [Myxococcota bacterium]
MHERVLAALGFCGASAMIALARPDQGIYLYGHHPLSYGFYLCGTLCLAVALFYLAIGLLSRPPGERKDAIAGSGGAASSASAALGWREKLAPAVLFCLGSVLGAFQIPLLLNRGLGVLLVTAFVGVMLFALGIHLWLMSIDRKLGAEPGSRFLPDQTPVMPWFEKIGGGVVLFTAANLFGTSLDRHEVLELWPLAFVPPFVPFLLYMASDRLQLAAFLLFEDADGRTTGSASVGAPQAEAT